MGSVALGLLPRDGPEPRLQVKLRPCREGYLIPPLERRAKENALAALAISICLVCISTNCSGGLLPVVNLTNQVGLSSRYSAFPAFRHSSDSPEPTRYRLYRI